MKKEELISAAELHALLAENGEDLQEFEMDEPIGTQHLHSLQKAVVLLSQQVADLQTQLHAHFELQNKQQEQLLRQFKYQIEHKLQEQLANGIIVVQQPTDMDTDVQQQDVDKESLLTLYSSELSEPADEEPTYSRVKSYKKIRKRKKSLLEKLFG
ncbi:hypothetical protein M5X11_19785 [Paenibacillus alginolyticus]|uniref:Uncharacterized protein n=1 Tax=Paenibacillus alginolyticus TaxID=59839 RepID=A0ABT4G9H0_9BACL|nr:hypothetical protein [Paenibacillus alginolyticus]MCY9667148.1 hypothetical protein [Paenibacillus alginolyticus]MCY9692826.1 hypothetical protein [Paenibacillus alginolyticus]MEC0148421.1 hypothetical protein [Paenibacillus alginolyticus]